MQEMVTDRALAPNFMLQECVLVHAGGGHMLIQWINLYSAHTCISVAAHVGSSAVRGLATIAANVY